MQTEAIFENIAERIGKELSNTCKSIYIAVAWFTNKQLFELLVEKAQEGLLVQLLVSNDQINLTNGVAFDRLNMGKSHSYLIGDGKKDLMHNKFCVIDENVVINGSYNWSYKAENNHENIIITKGDDSLAEQFIAQFKQIRNAYYTQKDAETLPLDKVIKRLEILKNYVILEDDEDIERETNKLKIYAFEQQIAEIITCLKQSQFSQAIELIEQFIRKNHQLVPFNDIDIAALKLEIRYLEHQLNAFDNEKTELEKTLSLFQHQHTKELGSLISRLLHLRKVKFRDDPNKFKEAEKDEQEYQQQVDIEEAKNIFELDEAQKKELKRNFRKASQICHPDKVSEEFKEMANETFMRLRQAYDENDLELVNEILSDLEKGNFFKARSETVNEKEKLKSAIQKLKAKITLLEQAIIEIKESEEYQTIIEIDDWDEYFADLKVKLSNEIQSFEEELEVEIPF